MIKRIFAILLAICMLFALAACQKEETPKETLPQDLMDQIQDVIDEYEKEHGKLDGSDETKPNEQKTERQLAQEDDSALGELCNAFMLSLADQDIYDEVLMHVCYGNVASYIDSAKEADQQVYKETTGVAAGANFERYQFGYDARQADGIVYYTAGHMRGVTITFQPKILNGSQVGIRLENGIINKFIREDNAEYINQTTKLIATDRHDIPVRYVMGTTPDYSKHGILSNMNLHRDVSYCYNRVRATVGDEIQLNSMTYKNSEYTVFINIGSVGGNQASAQDAIRVYGQWNGTNLK